MNIEVHHIVPEAAGGSNDIDNAIPLCLDCHSEVVRYNQEHPIGTKYKSGELKARRDQVYEEFTRHLVPPIHCEITQQLAPGGKRSFPDVGFIISHLGDSLPVRVRVVVVSVLPSGDAKLSSPFYSGEKCWNMNPRMTFYGHFKMTDDLIPKDRQLELRVTLSVIDAYEREHLYLPVGFVYVPEENYWYSEP